MPHRHIAAVVVAVIVILPTAQAGIAPVLSDPTGDTRWMLADGTDVPDELEPLRDLLPPDVAGDSADLEGLRFGENGTHLVVELDLARLPPAPAECEGPLPGLRDWFNCRAVYAIEWTYLRQDGLWGPPLELTWLVGCAPNGVVCGDNVRLEVGGTMSRLAEWTGPADRSYVTFERIGPDVARFELHKALVQEEVLDEDGDVKPARLCAGDLFANFRVSSRFQARGEALANVVAEDARDTLDTGTHVVRSGSPGCPGPDSRPEPGNSSELQTVHEDYAGDVARSLAGKSGTPRYLEPVWEAAFERNGSAVDVRALRMGEDGEHLLIELELAELPPAPDACQAPAGTTVSRCRYRYDVNATFVRPSVPWGPNLHATWTVSCRPECREAAAVQVGDGPRWTNDSPALDFERISPNAGLWILDKAVFGATEIEDPDADTLGPAELCRGDAFTDVRFHAIGWEESGAVRYRDWDDTSLSRPREGIEVHPYEPYLVQTSSPGCSGVGHPGTPAAAGQTPDPMPALVMPVLVLVAISAAAGSAWAGRRRRGRP